MQKSSFKFILGGGFKRFLLLPFPAWFNHQLVFFWWHKIPPREREREIHFSGCWGVSEGSLRSCFGSIFQSLGERVGNIFAAAPLHILQDVNSWGVGWTFDSKLMKDLQDLLLLWILVQFLKMHQLDFFYLLLFGTKHHVKGGIGDKFVFSCGISLLYHLPPQKFASSSMPRLRHRGRWKLRWRGEKEENSVSRFQLFHPWPQEVDSTMAKVGSQIPLERLLTFHIDFFTTLWALKIQKRYGGKKVPVRPRSGSFFFVVEGFGRTAFYLPFSTGDDDAWSRMDLNLKPFALRGCLYKEKSHWSSRGQQSKMNNIKFTEFFLKMDEFFPHIST